MNNTSQIFIKRTEILDKINHFSSRNKAFLFAIDFDGEYGFVLSPEESDINGLRYDIGGVKNTGESAKNEPFIFGFDAVSFDTYKNAFEKVVLHLKRGDTYLLNLTFPTPLRVNLSLDQLFDQSRAPFRLFVPGCFVVFSPEVFVRIADSRISCCPMKGTIDAAIPGAAQQLMSDEKERYEHNTIVDLIRNDLSMVSTHVEVTRFRYIDRINTNRGDLLQVSSEICGDLPPDYRQRLGDILFTLLPAGSVTGAPKEKTVEIIRAAETYSRGFYTGIFGFFDGHSLVSSVSIRFIEETTGGLVFKSGGGITALSDVESEYQEMLKKIYVPVV
ncbi:MAG: aminodeoxychorismate synthase component I [Bacteroidetes bacterium]|nr:aminodeoxychorismate synthase component I [Bacteroidota bacterium]